MSDHITLKASISLTVFREGWAYLSAGKAEPDPGVLPLLLNRALQDWLNEKPEVKVRATLPIQQHGQTIGIHVWYD